MKNLVTVISAHLFITHVFTFNQLELKTNSHMSEDTMQAVQLRGNGAGTRAHH